MMLVQVHKIELVVSSLAPWGFYLAFALCTSPITHLLFPKKFCGSIALNNCDIKGKLKTKVMQTLGEGAGGMSNKVYYGTFANGEFSPSCFKHMPDKISRRE